MKKILALLLMTTLVFVSCNNDDDNDNFIPPAQVFDVEGVNFTYESNNNLYSAPFALEEYTSFDILEHDGLLIYRYGELVDVEGNVRDGWELLPVELTDGSGRSFTYGFSHADIDAEIRITSSDYDISGLNSNYTQNQLFRFIIIPGEEAPLPLDANVKNIEEVMNALNLNKTNIENINLKK